MRIENPQERSFYEFEAYKEQWSVRHLQRQVASSLYGRLALSRNKDEVVYGFLSVTWYMVDVKGLNVQRRFSMAARDGKFGGFDPIPHKTLKEAKSLMRQFDAEVKQATTQKDGKRLCDEYEQKLIELLPDAEERLLIIQNTPKKVITNKWLNCTDDNYWVEDDEELNDRYFTVVCMPMESWNEDTDTTIIEQFFYLRDNCPYGWSTLAKSGAKFMVIEKPKS